MSTARCHPQVSTLECLCKMSGGTHEGIEMRFSSLIFSDPHLRPDHHHLGRSRPHLETQVHRGYPVVLSESIYHSLEDSHFAYNHLSYFCRGLYKPSACRWDRLTSYVISITRIVWSFTITAGVDLGSCGMTSSTSRPFMSLQVRTE